MTSIQKSTEAAARRCMVASMAIIAICIVFVALIAVPQWGEMNQEKDQIMELEYMISQHRAFNPVRAEILAQSAGMDRWDIPEHNVQPIAVEKLADLAELFSQASQVSTLTFHSAAPQAGSAGSRDGLQRAQAHASGDLTGIRQFLFDFENAGFVDHIEAVSIEVGENQMELKWAAWLRMQ